MIMFALTVCEAALGDTRLTSNNPDACLSTCVDVVCWLLFADTWNENHHIVLDLPGPEPRTHRTGALLLHHKSHQYERTSVHYPEKAWLFTNSLPF